MPTTRLTPQERQRMTEEERIVYRLNRWLDLRRAQGYDATVVSRIGTWHYIVALNGVQLEVYCDGRQVQLNRLVVNTKGATS